MWSEHGNLLQGKLHGEHHLRLFSFMEGLAEGLGHGEADMLVQLSACRKAWRASSSWATAGNRYVERATIHLRQMCSGSLRLDGGGWLVAPCSGQRGGAALVASPAPWSGPGDPTALLGLGHGAPAMPSFPTPRSDGWLLLCCSSHYAMPPGEPARGTAPVMSSRCTWAA